MYWQEDKQDEKRIVPDDIVDVVYNIACRCLPVDHAFALSQAIHETLPWFADEEHAGMHTIHVATEAVLNAARTKPNAGLKNSTTGCCRHTTFWLPLRCPVS